MISGWVWVILLQGAIVASSNYYIRKWYSTPIEFCPSVDQTSLEYPMVLSCMVCTGNVMGVTYNLISLLLILFHRELPILAIMAVSTFISFIARPAEAQLYVSLDGTLVELNAITLAMFQTWPLCFVLISTFLGFHSHWNILVIHSLVVLAVAALSIQLLRHRPDLTGILKFATGPGILMVLYEVLRFIIASNKDTSHLALVSKAVIRLVATPVYISLTMIAIRPVLLKPFSWSLLLWSGFCLPCSVAMISMMAMTTFTNPDYSSCIFDFYVNTLLAGASGVIGTFLMLKKPIANLVGIPIGESSLNEDAVFGLIWRAIDPIFGWCTNISRRIPFLRDFFEGVAEAVVD